MELKDLGNNIAKARIVRKLSAYELSLRLGKDASYIHKVETAKINISAKTLLEICKQLEIEPKVLFEN